MTTLVRSRLTAILIAGMFLAPATGLLRAEDAKPKAKPSAKSTKKARPRRPAHQLHGPADRASDGLRRRGVARSTRARNRGTTRGHARRAQAKPGMIVADVGAGVGYTSRGQRIGPKGKVYATDLQPEMLQMLVVNAQNAGVDNIAPICATRTRSQTPRRRDRPGDHG